MWVDQSGKNYTSQHVAELLGFWCGAAYTAESLESSYAVGQLYCNGKIWFQRLS